MKKYILIYQVWSWGCDANGVQRFTTRVIDASPENIMQIINKTTEDVRKEHAAYMLHQIQSL
jgi:hypothetical protein